MKVIFGLVFLEAGICGKACIATNVGGIPDIIISEETGILVNPESPDDIANALKRLLMDGALTKALGDKAKERVSSKFLIQSAINNQVDIYRKVLN